MILNRSSRNPLGHQAPVATLTLGALFALGMMACSAGGTNDLGLGGNNSGGAGSGTNANGTGSISNGTGSNTGGSSGTFSGTGTGTGTGVGGGCATTTQQAQKIPLDMYIMLDQSGSMDLSVGNGTRWDAVTSALKTFIQQPQSAGLGVGIQFFGVGPDTFNDSCTASDYANPLTPDGNGQPGVEIATLPGNATALVNAINAHSPNTLTPTSAALQGLVDHAAAWQQAHPDHVVVAVFATDGDPTECDTNQSNINAIAAAAFAGPQKIKTFVIGVGSSLTALNGIASAGGTNMAYLVDTNPQASQAFLMALNAIQGSSLACNYIIPPPPMGQQPDYGALNVEYTPGGGGQPVLIPNVANQAACPANGNAWYYDNPAAPTQIIFCNATCNTLKQDTMGQIHIVLGCKTVPA
jgi:hypothetical protein